MIQNGLFFELLFHKQNIQSVYICTNIRIHMYLYVHVRHGTTFRMGYRLN